MTDDGRQLELPGLPEPVHEGEIVETYGPPDSWPYLDATVMTNFDHTVNEITAGLLMIPNALGHGWAQHTAANFHGRVWYRNGRWHEQVWVRERPVATYSAASLQQLMVIVNDQHGWE